MLTVVNARLILFFNTTNGFVYCIYLEKAKGGTQMDSGKSMLLILHFLGEWIVLAQLSQIIACGTCIVLQGNKKKNAGNSLQVI